GYAPDAWSYLFDALREKGFSEGEIEQAGLSIKKESGGYYDRFRNRIIFPINDSSGRTVGFSGRTLETGKDVAKYINSPETPLFKKRDVLYGIDKAKLGIRKLNFSILVEGQMDLVLAHQALFRNTVATSGTALRGRESEGEEGVSNLELVKRISKNIVIAFDSDSAGIKASIKNARLALSLGMDVKIAALPQGSDPADVIKKDPKEWKRIIRESVDIVEFQLQTIEKAAKSKKDVLKGVRSELFETISAVQSKLEQEHYLGVVSEKLGLRNETLLEEFERFQKNDRLQSVQKLKTKEEADQDAEERGQERYALASHIFVFKRNKEAEGGEAEHFEKEYARVFEETPEDTLEKLDVAVRERY